MKTMTLSGGLLVSAALLLLGACSALEAKQPASAPMVPPKPITLPLGKNWQVIEEAPNLSDERGRVPFQTEQSLQPAGISPVVPTQPGAAPVTPGEKRIETPR